MKKAVPLICIVCGILLFLVPRYILPACEYTGKPHMHCSDTAQAEFVVAGVFVAAGVLGLALRKRIVNLILAIAALPVFGVALWLPEKFGYCMSPNMSCNYGMVPGIRFIAACGMVLMTIILARTALQSRKQE
jgi:hypothetical protein